MFNFFKKQKGAVTVIVTLLLIPSILISGTAVDVARMYATRSVVQDANQLASNAALTQYDAMLQDLYGIYGIGDETLNDMMEEYIEVSIFGEDWQNEGMGTLQLFYGAETSEVDVVPIKNLADPGVLRRQIEEYAKYRVPAAIVQDILGVFDSVNKIEQDSKIIKDKLQIDKEVEIYLEKYKELYESINAINSYGATVFQNADKINTREHEIHTELLQIYSLQINFVPTKESGNEILIADAGAKYEELKTNLDSLINGGVYNLGNWVSGKMGDDGEYERGYWSGGFNTIDGINDIIDNYDEELDEFIEQINEIVDKCKTLDESKSEIKRKIDDLNSDIETSNCTTELGEGVKSSLDEYDKLFEYSTLEMAEAFKSDNMSKINEMKAAMESRTFYANSPYNQYVTFNSISDRLNSDRFYYDLATIETTTAKDDVQYLKNIYLATWDDMITVESYTQFQDAKFSSTRNGEFYEYLKELFSSGGESKKDSIEDTSNDAMGESQSAFENAVEAFVPQGALFYGEDKTSSSSEFEMEGDWSSGSNSVVNELSSTDFSNLGDSIANKLLLIGYSSEMFSNLATGKGDEPKQSMAGIPFSTDVNYFYQSELEYLYNGNQNNAIANVASVMGLIFMIRFVSNYVSTFIVPEVKNELIILSAPALQFAGVVREILRVAYTVGESVSDVSNLVNGESVEFSKYKNSEWTFSLWSLLEGAVEETAEEILDVEVDSSTNIKLSYKNYLCIALLFVDGDEIAERAGFLMSLNVTNKEGKINADENSMSKQELLDMSALVTDFSVSTTVDMRMLFLTMPFARNGVNGVVPPGEIQITEIDYRGY